MRESFGAVNAIFTLFVGRSVKRSRVVSGMRLGWVSGATLGQA